MRFLTTPNLQIWNWTKSRIFELCWKFGSKIEFFDHLIPGKVEIWQNSEVFSLVKKFDSKLRFFDHFGPEKDEIWQDTDILSQVENLAKKWDFQPLWTCKGWNLAKSRNFQSHWKFGLKEIQNKRPTFSGFKILVKNNRACEYAIAKKKKAGQIFFSFSKMEVWAVVYLFCFEVINWYIHVSLYGYVFWFFSVIYSVFDITLYTILLHCLSFFVCVGVCVGVGVCVCVIYCWLFLM